MPRPKLAGLAAGALLLTLGSACSSPGVAPAAQSVPAAPQQAGAAARPPAAAAGGLATATTALGTVVTSDGLTVYRFEKDTAKPPTSNCDEKCAKAWPPVTGDEAPALQGIRSELVGTIDRPDGTKQLTLDGWPLYRFAKDARPGDTTGEGVGGAWHAIAPDGTPVTTAGNGGAAGAGLGSAPAATPASAPSSGSSSSHGS
ncbi:COG4315 family predicted lipoprotein [Pseudonocardia bannensis]|uniref:Lipoprotein with Yx(FWY)xxD motif n=1 Tax=Pseudonocardia bannensis TaxID=630973 RepID=A0A848DS35_9PSEU|nr:hypothetical protein [Pseudonocardia bannensis]NMH95191.1 hypothetical protein [Pseudonocardia bannensis]